MPPFVLFEGRSEDRPACVFQGETLASVATSQSRRARGSPAQAVVNVKRSPGADGIAAVRLGLVGCGSPALAGVEGPFDRGDFVSKQCGPIGYA